MRQVRRDEMIWNATMAMRGVSTSLRNSLASKEAEVRRRAESILAAVIVDKAWAQYEVLTSHPEGPPCPVISEGTAGMGIGGTEA